MAVATDPVSLVLELSHQQEVAVNTELDTLALAQEAVRDGVMQQNVLDCHTSLPPQVPNSMKHRYLLMHVSKVFIPPKGSSFLSPPNDSRSLDNMTATEDVHLGPEHIPVLTEFLTSYAHKWRLIGTMLGFQPQDLDYIQAEHASMVDSNKHNLISIISDWVRMKNGHTKPPTVNSLKQAL